MTSLVKLSTSKLPTSFGEFEFHVYHDLQSATEHVALVMGDIFHADNVLTRVHSECLTGDIFSSSRCDCGEQLNLAQQYISDAGQGLIVYLRNHEGRGIGLANKIRAYDLQDKGLDTVQANLALGLPVDARSYKAAAEILHLLQPRSIKLLSNNADKSKQLSSFGVVISETIPLITRSNPNNYSYLFTKQMKLGHALNLTE